MAVATEERGPPKRWASSASSIGICDGQFGEVMRQSYDQKADVLAEAKKKAPWRQASHCNECGQRLCLDRTCPPSDSVHVQHVPTQQNIAHMYMPQGYCLAWSPGPEVVSPQSGTSPTQTPNSSLLGSPLGNPQQPALMPSFLPMSEVSTMFPATTMATSLVGNTGCELISSSKGSPKNAGGGSARSGAGRHGKDRARSEEKTTVMFRNLPNDYSRQMLSDLLDGEKKELFWGHYDFVYLPMDLNRGAGLGFAFVNFLSHEDAEMARRHFQGFNDWVIASQKVCEVSWGDPLQGLAAHVERYRNSSVMHKDVVDEFRPVVFENGVRVAFPCPSKHIRHPHEAQRRRRVAMNRRAALQRK